MPVSIHAQLTCNIDAAAKRCGMTVRQFRLKQESGWPELHNKPLAFNPIAGTHGGYPRHDFYVDDVERLANLLQLSTGRRLGWIDENTYRNHLGDWLREVAVVARFKIPARSLRRWRKEGCRYNDGQIIAHDLVEGPVPNIGRNRPEGKVYVYSLKDVQKVSQRYLSEPGHKPHWDVVGTEWLPAALFTARFSVSDKFVWYWADKPSRLRRGEKALRSKPLVNVVRHKRGSPSEILFYRADDGERILRGEETAHEGSGRQIHPLTTVEDRDQKARAVIKEILANGPRTTEEVYAEARKAGVKNEKRLKRVREAIGVVVEMLGQRESLTWRLPDGKKTPPQSDIANGRTPSFTAMPSAVPAATEFGGVHDLNPGVGLPKVVREESVVMIADGMDLHEARKVAAAERKHTMRQPLLVLGEWGSRPTINGQEVGPLKSLAQHRVVKAVLQAGLDGLDMKQLADKSGQPSAHKLYSAVRKLSPEWADVLLPAGVKGGRYQVKFSPPFSTI